MWSHIRRKNVVIKTFDIRVLAQRIGKTVFQANFTTEVTSN